MSSPRRRMIHRHDVCRALPHGTRGVYWMPACTGIGTAQMCAAGITKSPGKRSADGKPKFGPDPQLPIADEIFLDHVGHFVRDPDAATRALARAGFAPTPVSI